MIDGSHKIENDPHKAISASTVTPETPLEVEEIKTEADFDRLEKVWSDVVERSDCTVFQTFEWQRTWWGHFLRNKRHELYCLVFKDDAMVVGIAPLYFERTRLLGLNLFTSLELIAGGYTDIIAVTEYRDRVFESLARHLRSISKSWDVFRTSQVSASSETPQLMLRHFRNESMRVYPIRGLTCPQVSLPATWDEYLKLIGQNMRHKVKRKTKGLREISDFEIELIESPGDDVDRAIKLMGELYGRRRRGLGDESWLDNPRNLSFITDVAERFARRGWLRVFFMKVGEARVATNLHFHFRKHIYGYFCGVDGPPEIMKYSPGFLLHCSAIKQGIAEGMVLYDMMFGSHQYKYDSFKGVPLHAWELHAVSPLKAHYLRFLGMQVFQLFQRAFMRLGEEYRDLKGYRVSRRPSLISFGMYIGERFRVLLNVLWIHVLQIVKGNRMSLEEADRDGI